MALQAGIDGYVQSGDKKGGRMGMTDARRGRAGDRGGEEGMSEMRGRK